MSTNENNTITSAGKHMRHIMASVMAATMAASVLTTPAHAAKKSVRKSVKTAKTTLKPKIPLPGSPCTERAANYPGTSLDCVDVAGKGLQWRVRGTIRNPFRLGEAVEVYSLESSRFRVVLTDWDSDITEESKKYGRKVCSVGYSEELRAFVRVYPLPVRCDIAQQIICELELVRNLSDVRYSSARGEGDEPCNRVSCRLHGIGHE